MKNHHKFAAIGFLSMFILFLGELVVIRMMAIDWSDFFDIISQAPRYGREVLPAIASLITAIYIWFYAASAKQYIRLSALVASLIIGLIFFDFVYLVFSVVTATICGWWYKKG